MSGSGRGKSKQARSKRGLSPRLKDDRISQLPDPLISHILSHLSTKDAVKTSVLSTRWRHLWLWLPRLVMDSEKFTDVNDFVSLGDRFFDSDRVSCIQKLKIAIINVDNYLDDASFLKPWIDAAVKRKVQHLDVYCLIDNDFNYEMPISLYSCETLVYLKLSEVTLDDAPIVSLPCLKTMHLEKLCYCNEAFFQRLVSGCPVLEELKILGCLSDLHVIRVHSLSLKSLEIELLLTVSDNQVVIDAPLLGWLKIRDRESQCYILNNFDSNAKLDISLVFGLHQLDDAGVSFRRNSIHDFLSGISKVGEMIIYLDVFKVFHLYSKLQTLPQFDCMSRLDATLCPSDLEWLPTFLGRCPNLKSLVLELDDDCKINSEEMNQISFSSVPECFLSSLVSVDIKSIISGYAAEIKLVRYFLGNSIILKKMTLHLDDGANANVILKNLLKIPRRSAACEVVVL